MNAIRLPRLRRLAVDDLAAVVALHDLVAAPLPVGFVRSRSASDLLAYLDGRLGVAYGIVGRGVLLAVSLLRLPVAAHPNEGPAFPLVPAADWPLHACFLENAMVRPDARGRGYQRMLFDVRLAHATAAGMRWLCGGVRLQNTVSWRNLLAKGMVIAGMRVDPGFPVIGVLRSTDGLAPASDPGERVVVGATDAVRHRVALQSGYVGVRATAAGTVVYQRRIAPPGRCAARRCSSSGRDL